MKITAILSAATLTAIMPATANTQNPHPATITYQSCDYVPSGSFVDNDTVEEIIFDGFIGHIDGYQMRNCPKLRRIVFNGPVFSTGGLEFARNCPELTDVEFNALVLSLNLTEYPDCNKLKSITINGAVYQTSDSITAPATPIDSIIMNPVYVDQIKQLARWQMESMNKKGWIKKIASWYKDDIRGLADKAELTEICDSIDIIYTSHRDPDEGKTMLQILKESPAYEPCEANTARLFTYTPPTDSLLTLSREFFNIDSIAGNGDDISRIKNLLYWVHDLVPHDGGSAWPDCHFNLRELTQVCREQQRGVNCRFMAIMLTEALLSQGIPARYITCQSKAWDEDSDCHVICVAWSDSLGKWVWVDPTFAAYVTDENGLLLHPGEVRYRLQHDLPLILNDDANWNHRQQQTKEGYLENYMAKNLYIMSANSIQQAEPEGKSDHKQGFHIGLTPVGSNYTNSHIIITDDKQFWQSPYHE